MNGLRAWTRTLLLSMLVAVAAAGLGACETMGTKEGLGTVLGGLAGGLVGSQVGGGSGRTAMTVVGAGMGAWFGSTIGRRMDENDRRRLAQALESSPPGHSTTWKSESTGLQHTVTTPDEKFVRNGQQCRRFVQEAIVDGVPQKMSGTACKRDEGSTWEAAA